MESPGGFPNSISLENILDRQLPRNRRIAEILALCGMVERSGQGMNLIYELSIREAKPLPDFRGTDDNFVSITLNGLVLDAKMLSLIKEKAIAAGNYDDCRKDIAWRYGKLLSYTNEGIQRLLDSNSEIEV